MARCATAATRSFPEKASKMKRIHMIFYAFALIIFIADQAVKSWVVESLGIDAPGKAVEVLSFFDLRFVANNGVSLGLLAAETELMRWLLVGMTALIAGGVAWWIARERNRSDLFGLSLVLGGALGNIVDRVRFGYVVDYADLHFGEWRPFLVFNVADAAITIGVVILLLRALFVRENPKSGSSGNHETGTDQPGAPVENANA